MPTHDVQGAQRCDLRARGEAGELRPQLVLSHQVVADGGDPDARELSPGAVPGVRDGGVADVHVAAADVAVIEREKLGTLAVQDLRELRQTDLRRLGCVQDSVQAGDRVDCLVCCLVQGAAQVRVGEQCIEGVEQRLESVVRLDRLLAGIEQGNSQEISAAKLDARVAGIDRKSVV